MKKTIFTLLTITTICNFANCQICVQNSKLNESYKWPAHSNWFFGRSMMLNFGSTGSGAPTVSTKAGNGFPYSVYESCASASDDQGNLVIFTNGVSLWDGNGATVVIPDNGGRLKTGAENSTGSAGSAVQGIIIVKHPLDTDHYYLFTTDDVVSGNNNGITYGFNYYVYTKSTNTVSPSTRLGTYRSTEHVAATWHNNGLDIWVSTHESSTGSPTKNYKSYLLSYSGLNETAVTSAAGFSVQANAAVGGYANERGGLQFVEANPSVRNITAAATHHCGAGYWKPDESVAILNFDNLTGQFSLTRFLSTNTIDQSNPWDCEFSPDGTKLYVTFQGDQWSGPLIGRVGYFPVSGGSFTEVANIGNGGTSDIGVLKLGGDGNIYGGSFNKSPWGYCDSLVVITDPNGTPSASIGGLSIKTASVGYGLPNMFLPPSDQLKIQDPVALTLCDMPYNFSSSWACKGTDVENTASYENAYVALSGQSSINSITGEFTTSVAGTHQISFNIGAVSDTLTFNVTACTVNVSSLSKEYFQIFPNPTNDKIHLSLTANVIELYSEDGKLVKSVLNSNSLDVKLVDSGMYFIKVLSEDKIHTEIIFIER